MAECKVDIIKDPALNFNGFYDQARQKLQAAQDLGKKGWDTCPAVNLHMGITKAIQQGHWVDLANYAMFMQARGENGLPIAGIESNEALRDALRLANMTISQYEKTIIGLKEGQEEALDNAYHKGANEALVQATVKMENLIRGMNKHGMKHGSFMGPNGMDSYEFGILRSRVGRISQGDNKDAPPQHHVTIEFEGEVWGGAHFNDRDEAVSYASKLLNVAPGKEQTPESRLNDGMLQGAIAELSSPGLSAYITCNRVGNENVITAQFEVVPPESVTTVAQAMTDIAKVMANQPVDEPGLEVTTNFTVKPEDFQFKAGN